MNTDIYDFYIPEHLIAKNPTERRSDSRLLVYYRDSGKIVDSHTREVADFLDDSYFLVFNNSRVIPARLNVTKIDTNVDGEFLCLKLVDSKTLHVMTDRARKYKVGAKVRMPDGTIVTVTQDIDNITKEVAAETDIFSYEYFERWGTMPLPPYMHKMATDADKERYQTVYSQIYGSAAAPTAGLHFDDRIFNSLAAKNIEHAFVSLHVGLGTFMPIYADKIEEHIIHKEEYIITEENAALINNAISAGKKILAVGTTSLRTLETVGDSNHKSVRAGRGVSDIYIYPPYTLRTADCLFTNFHTPKSSLAVLVSALIGVDELLRVYKYAVDQEYRFFSYGDAMLIL